jgi:hypothetical protein
MHLLRPTTVLLGLLCACAAGCFAGSTPQTSEMTKPCDTDAVCGASGVCYQGICGKRAIEPQACAEGELFFTEQKICARVECEAPDVLQDNVCVEDTVDVYAPTLMRLGAHAGSCDGVSDDVAQLRFVVTDGLGSIDPGVVAQRGGFSVALDEVELFEPQPERACVAQCGQRAMTCGPTLEGADALPELTRCHAPLRASASAPRFVATKPDRVFALLMENTTSLTGRLPASMEQLYPDRDGDGITDAQWSTQLLQEPERATDARSGRYLLANQLLADLQTVVWRAQDAGHEAWLGMWTFGGAPSSLASMLSGDAQLGALGLDVAVHYASQTPMREEAAIYEAMLAIITHNERLAKPELSDAEKMLVVFVDGPDEQRSATQSAERVIEEARARKVKITIIHLDPSIPKKSASGEPYLPDLPSYVERQAPCGSDADCHSFEQCRQTTGYALLKDQPPMIPANVDLTQKYCHIKRHPADGRTGPIDAFAQIACETQGNYIYVPDAGDAGDFAARANGLVYTLEGSWESEVTLDGLGALKRAQPYKVQLKATVTLQDSAKIDARSLSTPPYNLDDRLVLFTAP